MATIVSKTIGTGGDYSLPQLWEDACPADLVTADQVWRGLLKNQEFSSASTVLTISGSTVDSTRYAELTTDTGASFVDHATVSINPLRYDAAKGAAIKITGGYAVGVQVSQQYTRISKIQFIGTATGTSASAALKISTANGINCDINQCIFESQCASGVVGTVAMEGAGNIIRNSLVLQKKNSATAIIATIADGSSAYNCTFISLNAALTVGVRSVYAVGTLKNVYIGGVVSPISGTLTEVSCYSDVSATGFTVVPLSSATFENIVDGTHDFRLKAGSGLLNVGTDEATYAASDIIGNTRTSGSYDIGAYELTASTPAAVISWTDGSEIVSGVITVTISGVTVSSAWSEGSEVVSITSNSSAAAGTITTPVMKNNTGTILANETGVIVNVYDASTGALVVRKTGQTSSAGGIVTVTDVSILPATTYAYEIVLTGNGRRLPLVLST